MDDIFKPFYWHSRQSLVLTSPGTSWQAWRHLLQCFTVKIKTQHPWAKRKVCVILFFCVMLCENHPDRIRKMAPSIFISIACFKWIFEVFVVWILKDPTNWHFLFSWLPCTDKHCTLIMWPGGLHLYSVLFINLGFYLLSALLIQMWLPEYKTCSLSRPALPMSNNE